MTPIQHIYSSVRGDLMVGFNFKHRSDDLGALIMASLLTILFQPETVSSSSHFAAACIAFGALRKLDQTERDDANEKLKEPYQSMK
jgi:hypothetical protein